MNDFEMEGPGMRLRDAWLPFACPAPTIDHNCCCSGCSNSRGGRVPWLSICMVAYQVQRWGRVGDRRSVTTVSDEEMPCMWRLSTLEIPGLTSNLLLTSDGDPRLTSWGSALGRSLMQVPNTS